MFRSDSRLLWMLRLDPRPENGAASPYVGHVGP
jgi:hypothetical protein